MEKKSLCSIACLFGKGLGKLTWKEEESTAFLGLRNKLYLPKEDNLTSLLGECFVEGITKLFQGCPLIEAVVVIQEKFLEAIEKIKYEKDFPMKREHLLLFQHNLDSITFYGNENWSFPPQKTRSILELKGLGKKIWKDVDVSDYLEKERSSWNG